MDKDYVKKLCDGHFGYKMPIEKKPGAVKDAMKSDGEKSPTCQSGDGLRLTPVALHLADQTRMLQYGPTVITRFRHQVDDVENPVEAVGDASEDTSINEDVD